MPRFAVTIGSYGLPSFSVVNIAALRRLFGRDLPILISDDRSHASGQIEAIAKENRCAYYCSKHRRFHFCGDMQAVLNSLSFAKQHGAEWAVKVSQRLIMFSPKLRQVLDRYLSDPNILIALPGSPDPTRSRSPGFAKFPFLTDVMFLRTAAVSPEFVRDYYENHWKNGKAYWDGFVEITVNDLIRGPWKDKHCVVHELTNLPPNPEPKLFLRRYQATAADYETLSRELGVNAHGFDLSEWKAIEGCAYSPAPKA